jgi:hypothetical protein
MGYVGNVYKILVRKPEGIDRVLFKYIGYGRVDWIQLDQN